MPAARVTADGDADALKLHMIGVGRDARLRQENAEYMQVLKYEKGQFYRQHHDQQSAHWTPQGVRLYTLCARHRREIAEK